MSLLLTSASARRRPANPISPTIHPILYWPLDETSGFVAHDLSGNGYDGTYDGGLLTGAGFHMTDRTNSVTAATGSASGSPLDVGTGREWAIEAVVTFEADQPVIPSFYSIATQWRSTNFGYAAISLCMLNNGVDAAATAFSGQFTPINLTDAKGVPSTTAPVAGQRTHVLATRVRGSGSTDTMSIYVNGSLSNVVSIDATELGTPSNGAQFAVGFDSTYGWLGTVEHVAVYDQGVPANFAAAQAAKYGV